MKTLFTACLTLLALATSAQIDVASNRKFHEGSNLYINGKPEEALASVKEGLRTEPKNEKLLNLKKILEEEKKKKDQQEKEQKEKEKKQQQEQQKKDQQNKDQKDQKDKDEQKKDQKEQEQKDKEQKEKEEKEKKDQENKDDKQKDQKDKEQKEKEQKEKEQQEKDDKEKDKKVPKDVQQRLEQMKISEDKARMLLEAMKNQEVQYLQQNKRKATKAREKGKPDW